MKTNKTLNKLFSFFVLISASSYTYSLEYTFCLKSQDNKEKIKFTVIDIDYRYGFIQFDESYDASLVLWDESSLIVEKNDITTHTWVENVGGQAVLGGKYLITLEDWQGKNNIKDFSFVNRKNEKKKYYEKKSFYTKYGCKWSKDERLNLDTHGAL